MFIMDSMIYDLLYSVPKGADYAVDATNLDPADIPRDRVDGVMNILLHANNEVERFLAARLLTSWGYHEGLIALEKYISEYEVVKGVFLHRLHGYDDTFRQILLAIISYFSNVADRGYLERGRAEVYAPLSKIILLAGTMPFEISNVLDFVEREGFLEYVPLLKQHFLSIIDHPEIYRWKINDVVESLLRLDAEFVLSVLQQKGKTIEDFKV